MVVANIGINNDHLSLSFGIYDDSIDYSKRTTSVIQPLGRHKSAISLLTNSSNINTKIILGSNLDYYSDFRIYNKCLSGAEIYDLYNNYKSTKYNIKFENDTYCDMLIVAGGVAEVEEWVVAEELVL